MSKIVEIFSTNITYNKYHKIKKERITEHRKKSSFREDISREISTFIRTGMCYTDGRTATDACTVKNLKKTNYTSKQVFDAAIALVILVTLLPLFLVIAFAIKITSDGPIIFIQYRTGYMGRRFRMYKFRTMVKNAEMVKAQLQHLNHHSQQSPDFKIKNDPRLTPIGSFLRKYSLDELPQLFNIILGDMRFVGPRPTSFPAEEYEINHLSRLATFPGLTGSWQISGRSDINFDERVQLDCEYIQNQSPLLDLKILFKTPWAVLRGNGAY